MSIFDIKSPYTAETQNFPEAMSKLGYDIKCTDTIVDANARVMLEMAERIKKQAERIKKLDNFLDDMVQEGRI